jgi:hypothetical protein
MRDLKHRLERLEREAMQTSPGRVQVLVRFVGAKDGKAEPWQPQWASGGRHVGDAARITRERGEGPQAFEARARLHYPDGLLFMGRK